MFNKKRADRNFRAVIAANILMLTVLLTLILPKSKYEGLSLLDELSIPASVGSWQGTDISDAIDTEDERYNFISDIFARYYTDPKGMQILLLVLDAGNFHNPRACFELSGYKITELEPLQLPYGGRTLTAQAILASRGDENMLIVYWLCIDRKLTSWTGQKFKEFYSSLFGRKKAGFMIRLDIPLPSEDYEPALLPLYEFVLNLHKSLNLRTAHHLFAS